MRAEVVFRGQVLRHGRKTAVVCGTERVSYTELGERIARIASALMRYGVVAGDRVVLYLPNGLPVIELFYAGFSLGAILVPVTTRLTANELTYICQDCKPKAIAFAAESAGSIAAVLTALPGALCISVGGEIEGVVPFTALIRDAAHPLPPLTVEPEDAMIMYTSGTTGKPKGAIITHANLVTQHGFVNALEWGISHADRFLVTTPLTHRTGFARLANAMTLGGTLVVMPKFDAADTIATIEREEITVAGMVPTVCRMLLPVIEAEPARCRSLRKIVVTGEAFPVELKRRLIALLPEVRLTSFFAMTEVGGVTSLSHEEQFTHPASVGRPTPGVEIKIVDEADNEVAPGEGGELLVRTGAPGRYATMRAYFGLPEETAQAIEDGWFRTGDMARRDADGYLYIVDRKKDMVLSGGFNVYTKEVEQALISHPAIVDAAVIGVPDDIYGEAVTAFVECAAGEKVSAEEILVHIRSLIAGYKKPRHIFVVEGLPRNSLGKVLKSELRDMARRSSAEDTDLHRVKG
jgi:long-chain acyl-CoA synthetase